MDMHLKFNNVIGSAEVQLDVLKAICGDTSNHSMWDIGCGFAPQTRLLGFPERTFFDIVIRDLGVENKNFICGDILDLCQVPFTNKDDVIISLDNIEYFWEDDGRKIIKWMEESSRKQIIFTPQGRYMNVADTTDSHPDTHKRSWVDTEFEEMGWATITFPHFHPTLGEGGLGAFFAFKCENLSQEFIRVTKELKNKSWATK